jgi:hypothetical protein
MDVASRLAQIDLDERLTQLGVHDKDRAGIAAMVRPASPPSEKARAGPADAPPSADPLSRASLMRAEISSPERVWSWLIG